jgi:hypothetical protein
MACERVADTRPNKPFGALAQLVLGLIGDRFDLRLHPMNVPVYLVVLVGKLGEVLVVLLEVVDLILVIRELLGEFVRRVLAHPQMSPLLVHDR